MVGLSLEVSRVVLGLVRLGRLRLPVVALGLMSGIVVLDRAAEFVICLCRSWWVSILVGLHMRFNYFVGMLGVALSVLGAHYFGQFGVDYFKFIKYGDVICQFLIC